jgi:hypothetical protein
VIVLLDLVRRYESLSVERPPWGIDIPIPPPLAHCDSLAMVALEDALQTTDPCWSSVRIDNIALAHRADK